MISAMRGVLEIAERGEYVGCIGCVGCAGCVGVEEEGWGRCDRKGMAGMVWTRGGGESVERIVVGCTVTELRVRVFGVFLCRRLCVVCVWLVMSVRNVVVSLWPRGLVV